MVSYVVSVNKRKINLWGNIIGVRRKRWKKILINHKNVIQFQISHQKDLQFKEIHMKNSLLITF